MAGLDSDLVQIVRATKYPLDAFLFVQRGLDYTARRVHGEPGPATVQGERHVDGTTLCRGLCDFAVQQYGLMARGVLERWHIRGTEDFGRIVFAMVDGGLMQKTSDDSIRDFDGVLEFDQAFPRQLALDPRQVSATGRRGKPHVKPKKQP